MKLKFQITSILAKMHFIHIGACIFFVVFSPTAWTAECPYSNNTLKPWSDVGTWGTELPGEKTKVVLSSGDHVLLDVGTVSVKSITIEDGASLVFDNTNIQLETNYILVKGSLILGSTDCPITEKIEITLTGNKGDYNIKNFGEKFIGVDEGGVLEIHGEYKFPWSKLIRTVTRVQDGTFSDQWNLPDKEESKNARGIIAYVMDPVKKELASSTVIFRGGGLHNQCEVDREAESMGEILNNLPDGTIVGLTLKREMSTRFNMAMAYEILEQFGFGKVTGNLALRKYNRFSAWVMLVKKGQLDLTQDEIRVDEGEDLERAVELYLVDDGTKYMARSWVHTVRRGACYTRAKVTDAAISLPVVGLTDDLQSTWAAGDQVVFMSTDYDWRQAELATVTSCPNCGPNEFTIDIEPRFTHFGEIYKNVDMRGEVGLLTRQIVIKGGAADNSKTFGGHVKFLKGFKDVHVENAEFVNMGQADTLGNYPLHFHMCEDVDNYSDPPYIRGNSIHDSNARCLTVHGTHGVLVENNVCFKSVGHGYFLEDGGEKRNVFDGNLGAGQTRGSLVKSDALPTTFWITNPQTYFRNNVAAGSDNVGIWFIYPDIPTGPSASKGFMAQFEARHTAIYEFDNNVAHSNRWTGLNIDNRIRNDTSVVSNNFYEAYNDPLDDTSGYKTVELTRFTGYKNMIQNAGLSGSKINLVQSSLSDSLAGIIFRRRSVMESYMSNSVIVGESPNLGDPSIVRSGNKIKTYPRSVPMGFEDMPRQGFVFSWSPVYLTDTWFGDFTSTADYNAGAIGFYRNNQIRPAAAGGTKGIRFGFEDPTTGLRVFDGNATDAGFSSEDGDDASTFIDFDGSVSSITGGQIVKSLPFHLTSACTQNDNWKVSVCPHSYGQVVASWSGKTKDEITVNRDDDLDDPIHADKHAMAPFLVLLGGDHSYMTKFKTTSAQKLRFMFSGITKTGWVRIGACVPRNAKLDVFVRDPTPKGWKRAVAVDDVDAVDAAENMQKYYFDAEVGVVFVKAIADRDGTDSDKLECLDNYCPMVSINIKSGDLTDSDCSSRAYPKYQRSPITDAKSPLQTFTNFDVNPPTNWGAGATRPSQFIGVS